MVLDVLCGDFGSVVERGCEIGKDVKEEER